MTNSIVGKLSTTDHSRDAAGLTYVYPVLSRRSGGLSIGINLNPNNACNWQCVYCQVPGLTRGRAPHIDLGLLEQELRGFLGQLQDPSRTSETERAQLRDIAISGNGEPTSCGQLGQVISIIAQVIASGDLPASAGLVLITNGSLAHQTRVQKCLAEWGRLGGEVWFKLDRATPEGLRLINGARMTPPRIRHNLRLTTSRCKTWIQTCVFTVDGSAPDGIELDSYLRLLKDSIADGCPIAGVLLYGLARPSMQPAAKRLSPVSSSWLERLADRIRKLGLMVKTNP